MFAALACLLAAQVQPSPAALVSLDLPAMRVDQLLERLGRQTGSRLAAMGTAKDHYVLVSVRDMPLSDLKNGIASAVHGAWHRRGNLEVLSTTLPSGPWTAMPSQDGIRKWLRENPPEPVATEEAIRTFLVEAVAATKEPIPEGASDLEASARMASAYRARGPLQRASVRMAHALGESVLASLRPGQRAVFSDRPTRLQRKLPPAGLAAIALLEKERGLFAKAAKGIAPDVRQQEDLPFNLDSGAYGYSGVIRTHVEVSQSFGLPCLVVSQFGESGQAAARDAVWIAPDPYDPVEAKRLAERQRELMTKIPEGLNVPVLGPQPDLDAALGLSLALANGAPPTLSPPALAALEQADKRDLLAGFPSLALAQAARTMKANLIAFVPDSAALAPWVDQARPLRPPFPGLHHGRLPLDSAALPTVGGFLAHLLWGAEMNWPNQAGGTWVIAAATSPAFAEASLCRFDRSRLAGAFMRAKTEGLSLESAAGLAVSAESPRLWAAAWQLLLAATQTPAVARPPGINASHPLIVYGLLSEPQRREARNGGLRVPLARTGALADRINALVFASVLPVEPSSSLSIASSPQAGLGASPIEDPARGPAEAIAVLEDDPTVALAEGWDSQAHIEIKVVSLETVFLERGQSPPAPPLLVQPDLLASLILGNEYSLQMNKVAKEAAAKPKFSVGSQDLVAVTARFGRPGFLQRHYQHLLPPHGPGLLSLDQLPIGFLKELEGHLQRIRRLRGIPPPARR